MKGRQMKRTKRREFEAQLPATPCTPQLRQTMFDLADEQGVSVAELQRNAITLFLATNYSKAIENISQNIGGDRQPVN